MSVLEEKLGKQGNSTGNYCSDFSCVANEWKRVKVQDDQRRRHGDVRQRICNTARYSRGAQHGEFPILSHREDGQRALYTWRFHHSPTCRVMGDLRIDVDDCTVRILQASRKFINSFTPSLHPGHGCLRRTTFQASSFKA